MISLCTYLFCLSGICLGSLQAYPIQDASSSEDLHHGTKSSESLFTPSRLDRLFGTYMNLVRAEIQDSKTGKISDNIDKSGLAEVPDYGIFVQKNFPGNVKQIKVDSGKIPSSLFNAEYDDYGSEPEKRTHQSWYASYGKRNGADLFFVENIGRQPIKSQDADVYNGHEIRHILSNQLIKNKNTPISSAMKDDALLSGVANGFNSDVNDNNWELGITNPDYSRIRNSKRQAHQGWYSQYGKRNDDDFYSRVL